MAIVKDLKEQVEYIRMGLLDFIQKDDGIGLTAYFFSELAALFVTDISGRRTHEARHGKLLHVFAHVDSDERVFAVEEELGQHLG